MESSSVSSNGVGAANSAGASASQVDSSASVASDNHAQTPSTTGAGLAQAQTAETSLRAGSGVNGFDPGSGAPPEAQTQAPGTAGAGLTQATTPGDRLRGPTTADALAGAADGAGATGAAAPTGAAASTTAAAAASAVTESKFKIGDKTFVVEGGTAAQRTSVEKDLREVFGTKRGAQMLTKLEARSGNFKVDLNVTNNAYARLGGNSIHVDPNFHPTIQTNKGPLAATTQRIMAHELGHAVFGTADNGPARLNNVKRNENPIMNELGEPSRTKY
jgi:hypothetical protein